MSKKRWQAERRVEELSESGDDDGEGVEITIDEHTFAGDELHFTGVDLGSGTLRRRGKHASDEESEESEESEEEDSDDGSPIAGPSMQLMLREKEDYLVERALERIRRAQMLGKTNVKLSQQELDALERKRIQVAAPKMPRSKKTSSSQARRGDRKRTKGDRSSGNSPQLSSTEVRKPGRSSLGSRTEGQPPYPVLSGESYGNPGPLVHGYYGPQPVRPSSSSSRTSSRNPSSQSLRQAQQHSPPMPQYQHPYMQGRYYSVPEGAQIRRPSSSSSRASTRLDPTDPSWEPRARSNSTIAPYPLDPAQYQVYPAPGVPVHFDPRFAPQGRRVASGPPDVYPGQPPPAFYRYPPEEMVATNSSDPTLAARRRRVPPPEPSSSSQSSSSTDEDEGVQVEVVEKPTGGYDVQTKASASSSKPRGGGSSKRGRGRKT